MNLVNKPLTIIDWLMSGYGNTDYGNTNFTQVIMNNKGKIFDFPYDIDPTIKDDFENKFLLHFADYALAIENGQTILHWKMHLSARMNDMFPLYNQFITKMKKELTGSKDSVSRETYTKTNKYTSDRKANGEFNSDANATSDVTDNRINREFPHNSVVNPDAYESDSYTDTSKRSDLNSATNKTSDTQNISDNGNEDFERTQSHFDGISDIDFLVQFRSELTSLYEEIFKYCIDLFIFVW